jgi:TIR domain
MADLFISYARGDRAKAKLLAEALAREGWSVWWDRNIPPGKSFDEVIEEALDSAKCVIVLWSNESVSSNWVKAEAAEGARHGILVPVLLERVKPPLEFRRLQAADLSDWRLSDQQAAYSHPEFAEFLKAITQTLGGAPTVKMRDVPMPQARESGPQMGSLQVQERWHAELIETGWLMRRLRVHLTEESHVIELTNRLTGEVVAVDGTIRCKGGSLTEVKEYFDFDVSDGKARVPVAIGYKVAAWGGVSRFRLSVAGRTLYSEEGS